MAEPWPQKFPYSHKTATFKRNLAIIFGIGVVFDLVFSPSGPFRLLGAFSLVSLAIWFTLWGRGLAAEAWPDHILLPGYWWPTLREIRYEQILSLEKISDIALMVTYSSGGRRKKSGIQIRLVEGADRLETLLRMKTGLELKTIQPWWLRLSQALGHEQRLEEPGAWRQHFLRPLRAFVGAVGVLILGFACILGFDYFWADAPAWLVLLVAAGLPLGVYLLVVRRRRRKTPEGSPTGL